MKKSGYNFEVYRNYDILQRIVRNPEYERLCQEMEFDEDGFSDPLLFKDDQVFEQIHNNFGLSSAIEPSVVIEKKYDPEFFSKIPIFEKDPFACMLKFHESSTQRIDIEEAHVISTPISNIHYLDITIDRLAPAKAVKSALKEYLSTYRGCLPMGLRACDKPVCEYLMIDDDRLELRLNMLSFEKDIFQEIERNLSSPSEHLHFEKRNGCYSIWDRRKEQESFSNIALRFKLKHDQCRKRFTNAFKLITGYEYSKSQWKGFIRNHLIKKAQNAREPEQFKAFEELGRFEDVKQQEKLVSEIKTSKDVCKEDGDGKKPSGADGVCSSSLYGDPEVTLILKDISENICPNCPDDECKTKQNSTETIEDLSELCCPRIFDYLKHP